MYLIEIAISDSNAVSLKIHMRVPITLVPSFFKTFRTLATFFVDNVRKSDENWS